VDVESDPIGPAGGSLSPHVYVGNDPVFLLDPTGLADLNLFDPTPGGHDSTGNYAGGNIWNIPGVYTGKAAQLESERTGMKQSQ